MNNNTFAVDPFDVARWFGIPLKFIGEEVTVETRHLAGLVWQHRVWVNDLPRTRWSPPYPTEQMAIDRGFMLADQKGW